MSLLDMIEFIDDTFVSVPADRYRTAAGAGYVDGIWDDVDPDIVSSHKITLQPLTDKELLNIQDTIGGERIGDARKIYVNDGDLYKIQPSDEWQFTDVDGRFKTFSLDNRPWHNYCKVIVYKIDDKAKV